MLPPPINSGETSRSQRADLSGEGHINVQIQGDKCVVLIGIGRSPLELTLPRGRPRDDEAAKVLSPYSTAVRFVGRERELSDLWAWIESDQRISIRVITAPGGGGKTRLALEFCKKARKKGWNAGFVTSTSPPGHIKAAKRSHTLAVVDYASARRSWLHHWLYDLANSPPTSGRLRILLLERYADTALGWWVETFRSGSWGDSAVRNLLDPRDGPYQLQPLQSVEQRRDVLEATLKSIGSDLRLPHLGEKPDFDRQLAELSWGDKPLFLLMAALATEKDPNLDTLSRMSSWLASEVAEHELARIAGIAESRALGSKDLVCHMAAYVTLCQGLTCDQVEKAVEDEGKSMGYGSVGAPRKLYKALHDALPGGKAAVAPILPDMVGEAAILIALGDKDQCKARESVVRAATKVPERVTEMVIRLAQDFGGVEPVEWLECLAAEAKDLQALRRLVTQLPRQTLVLGEIAARLTAAMVERLQKEGDKEELARFNDILDIRLGDLGRHEEALEAVQEAVKIWRELSQSRPDFLPDLSLSLNNLANRLSDLGRREEALKAEQELVDIQRELSQLRPDEFRPDLAMSLKNLSSYLNQLGRGEEALKAMQESVDVYRELSQSRSDMYRRDLAISLNILSICLSDLGRLQEALEAGKEAVAVGRELAQSRPEAFRPDLAKSLNNLSNYLSNLGQREEALQAVQEAVDIYRELSRSRPEALGPDLADALNNRAFHLRQLGRLGDSLKNSEEALKNSEEAVRILLSFFQAYPAAFGDIMARMMALYLELLEENGQQPDPELMGMIDSTFQENPAQ